MKAGAQAAPHLPSDFLQKILHRLVEARRLGRINDLRGFSAEPEVRSIAGPMSAEGGERTLPLRPQADVPPATHAGHFVAI